MAMIGYARENRAGTAFETQLVRLSTCDRLFHEAIPLTDDGRPRWAACLTYLRPGDTLVVCRVGVIARSLPMLCAVIAELMRRTVNLQVLDSPLDTRTPSGATIVAVLPLVVALDMQHRAERQSEGVRRAYARGIRFGRVPQLAPDQQEELCRLRRAGMPIARLMAMFQMSKASLYRYLRAGGVCGSTLRSTQRAHESKMR